MSDHIEATQHDENRRIPPENALRRRSVDFEWPVCADCTEAGIDVARLTTSNLIEAQSLRCISGVIPELSLFYE